MSTEITLSGLIVWLDSRKKNSANQKKGPWIQCIIWENWTIDFKWIYFLHNSYVDLYQILNVVIFDYQSCTLLFWIHFTGLMCLRSDFIKFTLARYIAIVIRINL